MGNTRDGRGGKKPHSKLLDGFRIESGRYLILGSIDGILAVLGVVVAASTVSESATVIVNAGIGGAIALAMTNGLGSYLAEGTVEYGKLSQLERPLLKSLKNTKLERETKKKIRLDSIIHGFSSLIGSMVPLLPFFFFTPTKAVYMAIGMSVVTLMFLGMFSGIISRQNIPISILKMVGLGLLVVLVITLAPIHQL
ncbi:MAG: VIT1/CCC1 transporter family protein [Methermicoccaceae archaeon]